MSVWYSRKNKSQRRELEQINLTFSEMLAQIDKQLIHKCQTFSCDFMNCSLPGIADELDILIISVKLCSS